MFNIKYTKITKITMTFADAARVMAFLVVSTVPLPALRINSHIKAKKSQEQEWLKKKDAMHKERLLKACRKELEKLEKGKYLK